MISQPCFSPAGDFLQFRASPRLQVQTPFLHSRQISSATCDATRIHGFRGLMHSHQKRTHLLKRRRQISSPSAASVRESVEETLASTSENRNGGLINSELSALDAYFDKLQSKPAASPLSSEAATDFSSSNSAAVSVNRTVSTPRANSSATQDGLRNLEDYLDRLARGSSQNLPSSKPVEPEPEPDLDLQSLLKELSPALQLGLSGDEDLDLEPDDSIDSMNSDSYVVYVIAAVNIAVYLFGLASPVDTAGVGTSTLPVLYGAKVNELLLDGEWWRLITPMFLHSGFLHIALSSWSLLFFGPQVENVFGPLAFCMIYFLGGLWGNTFSFFFTPDATVGGTGPLFALFSAWVAYLWQNRRVIGEESADYGIKATTLMGVLVLGLSYLIPTDEWIHVGAVLPGLLFGAFSCPILQVLDTNDSNVNNMEDEQSRKKAYAVYDSPSSFGLILLFIITTAVCFGVLNIYGPFASEFQLLEIIPF